MNFDNFYKKNSTFWKLLVLKKSKIMGKDQPVQSYEEWSPLSGQGNNGWPLMGFEVLPDKWSLDYKSDMLTPRPSHSRSQVFADLFKIVWDKSFTLIHSRNQPNSKQELENKISCSRNQQNVTVDGHLIGFRLSVDWQSPVTFSVHLLGDISLLIELYSKLGFI